MDWILEKMARLLEWFFPRPPLYEDWMFDEKNWEPPEPIEDLGDPFVEEFRDLYK